MNAVVILCKAVVVRWPPDARVVKVKHLAVFSIWLTSLAAVAQETPAARFEEELVVTEVLLDVLVTDKRGNVIIGLGAEDFRLEDEGEPVPIDSVTFYSSRKLEGSAESLERQGMTIDQVPEDRYIIFFFQQQRQASSEVPGLLSRQLEAAEQSRDWLGRELLPRDWVAVVTWDNRLQVVQDFTFDVEALQAAVVQAARGYRGGGDWPSRRPPESAGPSLWSQLPEGKDLGKQTTTIYTGLQVLARAAGAIQGRKILLFFGRGFGEISAFGSWQPDRRYHQATMDALNDNNVAVYTLDVMPQGTRRHTFEQSLDLIAAETGGESYRYFTTFTVPLQQVSDANSGYYLLSYQSQKPPGTKGFQRVKVSTRNPELSVQARQGYLIEDE